MSYKDPLKEPKDNYKETIDTIRSETSGVGIDPQYTHVIIIEFLKQISARLDRLERIVEEKR